MEWEEKWWEASNWAGMREMGAEKVVCFYFIYSNGANVLYCGLSEFSNFFEAEYSCYWLKIRNLTWTGKNFVI